MQQSKKKSKIVGSFNYDDSANGISIQGGKISSLSFNGNQAHFTGTAKGGKGKGMSFTVDVIDNGEPGTLDTFSIQASRSYSASGNLLDGDITVH